MDPLGAESGLTNAEAIPRWSDTKAFRCPDYTDDRDSQFPFNAEINKLIALWEGDITKLNCDLVVNSTNEALNDKNPISERIHRVAGPLLKEEVRNDLVSCRTGEAKMTKGYNLPGRYVVHTVSPRYNTKYKTAAESALYMCYRNVLQQARENKLVSIGMGVINTTRRGYPPEEGAHIALRTVRRYLESNMDCFNVAVFVVEPIDESTYKRLMPLYFPRDKKEEQHAIDLLPTDIGNDDGEPFIAERQIRIMDRCLLGASGIDLLNSFVGRHPFAAVAGDHDMTRQARLMGRTQVERNIIDAQRRYSKWVKRSRTEDFTDIAKMGFLYNPGVDRQGRPVVVFIGRYFPANAIDLNKAVSYFIHFMDSVATREYVFIYCHSLTTEDHHLELSFLKDIYDMLDSKYRTNLYALYLLHGTVWMRLVTWFFLLFNAASIREKVHYLDGVQYLYDSIQPDQVELPPFVIEHDTQENGPQYHTPVQGYQKPQPYRT